MPLALAAPVTVALLLLLPLAGIAAGGRVQTQAYLGPSPVSTFEVTLQGTQTDSNTTIYLPINGSAKITYASLNVSGRPKMTFVNLSGRGVGLANGEEYGGGTHGGGDYNNDGYDDLAIGAFAENSPGLQPRVELYLGSAAGVGTVPNWSYIGINGSGLGWSIAHGDYNHDGTDDLVVGESSFSGTSHNETVFVFYGSAAGLPSTPDLSLIWNPSTRYSWGSSLAGAIDLDDDTYDDLVVAEAFNGTLVNQGTVRVLWGGASGLSVDTTTLVTGFDTFKRVGQPPVSFSRMLILESIGDTDGDGFDEFAAGTPETSGQFGSAQVFEGSSGRNITRLWNYANTFQSYFGWAIAGGDDITGDGIPDLVVGAPVDPTSTGAAYVFNGAGGGTYAGTPSTTLTPDTTAQFQFGSCVDIMPDFDGDGKAELAIGGNLANTNDGMAFLYRGHVLQTGAAMPLRPTVGTQEQMGFNLGTAGDLNGDGFGDFAVQLRAGDNGTSSPGVVRAYYGAQTPNNLRIFVNRTLAAQPPGAIAGNLTVTGFAGLLDAYLQAHRTELDASGAVRIPLSINFSGPGSGTLNVSAIQVTYSVVLPPPNVIATAPGDGTAIIVSWSLQATDGNLFSVWSNKSGPWAIVGNVSFPRVSFNDTNITVGRTYWYYLTEWDTSVPIMSGPSLIVSATAGDVIPPMQPLNFVISKNNQAHQINVTWSANIDDTMHYEIWRRDGDSAPFVRVANVSAPSAAYSDAGLQEEVNYSYQIRAVDDVGLTSPYTPTLTERIPDLTPPLTPANFNAVTHPSGTGAILTWTPNAFDTVAYLVMRSGSGGAGTFAEVGRPTATPYNATGLTRGVTYFFHLLAVDKADLRSPATATVAVFTVDTLAPNPPVLTGANSVGVGNTVQVNWSATGDDLGAFRVYVDASGSWVQAAEVGSASRLGVVTNLTDGVSVSFRVTAVDTGGREGAFSNTVSATPSDTQRPGAATGLSVTPPAQGATLRLTWLPPADPDVAGFKVFVLDPTVGASYLFVATVTGALFFDHNGLQNGIAYRYQLTAFDEVPNEGPPSAFGSGTPTDMVPPSPPVITTASVATNTVNLPLAGTADPNVDIQIWVRGILQSTEQADATGDWTGTARLITGDNVVYAVAIDPSTIVATSAKTSENSQSVHFTLDTQRPATSSTTPAAGATGVNPAVPVFITFSERVRPASVAIVLTDSSGNAVAGDLVVDTVNHTARFTPSAPLQAGMAYTVQVNATDLAGNAMAPQTITFTTQAAAGGGTGGGGFIPGFESALGLAALALAALALAFRRRPGQHR